MSIHFGVGAVSDYYIMMPIVALIGRPNVGKSTLFNRVTRKKDAIVDDLPGVTRDRHYGDAEWNDTAFTLVDTGGFLEGDGDDFASQIRRQVMMAIEDADVIVFVLDGKSGGSPFDADIVQMLREVSQPVFYVINKIDGIEKEDQLFDFYSYGIDAFHTISAEHGYGVPDFLDALTAVLPKSAPAPSADEIKLAVVGRPNVGKSSLVNRILGQERLLVSDIPGTTRDAIDTMCQVGGKTYRLIDTAGIRRKGRVSRKLEKFSILKSLKSLDRCDVALIVIDAGEGVTEQDIRIAGYAHERGCGCIILINKWDLVQDKDSRTSKRYIDKVRDAARFLSFAPVLTVSALTGQRVSKMFKWVDTVFNQYRMRIGTGQLNKIVESALARTEPSLHKGKRLKFYYATQVSAGPPTFVFFVNYPEAVHFSYRRYLANQIREATGLSWTPIRVLFRLRTGRIEFGNKKRDSRRGRRGRR